MRAFHGENELKEAVLRECRAHEEADAFVQASYWYKVGLIPTYWRNSKGCSLGCILKDEEGGHRKYPKLFGLPIDAAEVQEIIFEGSSEEFSKTWTRRFFEAIPVGSQPPGRLFEDACRS